MRDAKAIQKHWCLAFAAYSLLHLDCLPASLKQSRLPIKTIGEACRQQAQSLIEALILYASQQLEQGQKANDLFSCLFAPDILLFTPKYNYRVNQTTFLRQSNRSFFCARVLPS